MDASQSQEMERGPPMEPEEVKEVPPLLSPEQQEAKHQAEEEIRHLEARASVMKQQMERQAEILVRQEEMVQANDPTAVYGQGYLPPNVPPTPQFSPFDSNNPMAPQPSQPSSQQAPLPNDPYPAPAAGMNASMSSHQPSSPSLSYAPSPANSSPMMYRSSPHVPPSPSMHSQASNSHNAQPVQQQPGPAYDQQQVYGMEQQQHSAPLPQDSGMYYQSQPPQQFGAVKSFRAQEQESKYREYALSPSSQGTPTANGSFPHRHETQMGGAINPPPHGQYYHQQGGATLSDQQGFGFTAEPVVTHMHHQAHSETYTCEQTNPNVGMQYSQQQQRETIQSMAVNPNMQQAYYYGNSGPREGSEANVSEPSFDPSSISHLTQSTLGSQHLHPQEQPQQQPQEEPLRPARDPPSSSGVPSQQAPSPRPVAPVLSPEALKSARTNGFGSDSDSDFDNPTFSPQYDDNKSSVSPSATSKAISEAEKSGTSWWKGNFSDDSPGTDGKKLKPLQSVAESHPDNSGFPASDAVPSPSPAALRSPVSMMPSSPALRPAPVHHPARSPSPAMNSVASSRASHFTAASVASADSLGRRLAAKLNINPDDDEDVFSGLEDGTVLQNSPDKPSPKPRAMARGELPNEDIFDGIASPVASTTASRAHSALKAAPMANLAGAQSTAMAFKASSGLESKSTVELNAVEAPKALMDDATSFAGSASLIGSTTKRSVTNMSGQNPHSLNLEYSTTSTGAAIARKENTGAPATTSNEPATAAFPGMEKVALNESNAAGVLGLGDGSAKQNQFMVVGMEDQNILEFEDAGTVTSDITSSIVDTGPTARKEAYEAYAAGITSSAKYEPILEGDAESKSRASTGFGKHVTEAEGSQEENEDIFDPDVNTIDNTVDDTLENTFDHTFDSTQSKRRGQEERRRGNEKKGRKSRRQYFSESYSDSDAYDTFMTSMSGASSGSRPIDFFSRLGCGVLDSIATQCAGHGPRPHSFDDRTLDGDLYNEEGGPTFDRTLDNSTLNDTLGTGTGTENGGLSKKVSDLQLLLFSPWPLLHIHRRYWTNIYAYILSRPHRNRDVGMHGTRRTLRHSPTTHRVQ